MVGTFGPMTKMPLQPCLSEAETGPMSWCYTLGGEALILMKTTTTWREHAHRVAGCGTALRGRAPRKNKRKATLGEDVG